MRTARLLLTFLLGLGMALQGYAQMLAMDPACSMSHATGAHSPAAAAAADAQAGHGAAGHAGHHMGGSGHLHHPPATHPGEVPPDHDAQPRDDANPCNCFGGCHAANPVPAELTRLPASPLMLRQAPLLQDHSFSSFASFRHWRPPASI